MTSGVEYHLVTYEQDPWVFNSSRLLVQEENILIDGSQPWIQSVSNR